MVPRLLFPLFALALLLLSSSTSAAQEVRVTENSPPEVLLAFIDTNQMTLPADLVRQYASLLNRLDARCEEERKLIGDQAVKATQILKEDKDVDLTVLQMLRAWDNAVPSGRDQRCSSILATLMVIIGESTRVTGD